jgi:uncharacterized protein YodC (DUF2158 family)
MAEAFGIGDIVRLKSGGPDMAIESFEANPSTVQHPHVAERLVRCLWMANDVVQTYVFWPHLLVGEKKTEPEQVRREDMGRTLTAKDRAADGKPGTAFTPAYPPSANRDHDATVRDNDPALNRNDPAFNREVATV